MWSVACWPCCGHSLTCQLLATKLFKPQKVESFIAEKGENNAVSTSLIDKALFLGGQQLKIIYVNMRF